MKRLATLVLFAAFAVPAIAAPDEEALGKSKGYPVCPMAPRPAAFEQHCLVGTLSHYDKLVPARSVARAQAPWELKRIAKEPPIRFRAATWGGDVDAFLNAHRNTGLLVLRGDTILVERYQYDRKPEQRMHSFSMAKTVLAMLVGIARAEGSIKSIDDRADAYVAGLKGHPYGEVSLRHLLTMSSGMEFREDYDGKDDIAVLASRTYWQQGPGGVDTVASFRARKHPPGTRFYYSSADSQVLALVLRAAVGKPLAEYLSEKIWQPMGAEADASWLIDAGGYEFGYTGINATLRDWGRFGLLLAHDGAREGRQIIPADWVKAATRAEAPHLAVGTATRFNGYGYQTWLIHPKQPYFALMGVRGQGVFVDPGSKLVIVHTAVHAQSRDPARGDQFALFFGAIDSLSKHMSNP